MIESNLLLRTTNGEQHVPDTSQEETYRTVLQETVAGMDEAQVHLFDVPLDPSVIEVVFLHPFVDKCSRPDL